MFYCAAADGVNKSDTQPVTAWVIPCKSVNQVGPDEHRIPRQLNRKLRIHTAIQHTHRCVMPELACRADLDADLRKAIFELLAQQIAPATNKAVGRPGMTLWSVLVCGVLRLDLNIDYDRLHELVNNHGTIRQMLGHATFDDTAYHHQTLKDNVRLLTPELLEKINVLVVQSGHGVVKKRPLKSCMGGATPLSLKLMFTTPPTSTCCWTRCAKSSA